MVQCIKFDSNVEKSRGNQDTTCHVKPHISLQQDIVRRDLHNNAVNHFYSFLHLSYSL
jgi:hypothetical protein